MQVDFKKIAKELAIKANTELRKDFLKLLREGFRKEKNKRAKKILKIILENAQIAKKERLAICQDTGLPLVFLEVGRDIKINKKIIEEINEGIVEAYKEAGFRASVIDILTKKISYNSEFFNIEFVNRKGLKITVFVKGFGSENKSQLRMFNPTASFEEIEDFILEAVKNAGPDSCPPFVVGIGIGGTADTALLLAKKALLERLDTPNPTPFLDKWEKRLLKKINSLNIGPMGLGGLTCLKVRIKTKPTHIAGLPVGINISCHALRSKSKVIKF